MLQGKKVLLFDLDGTLIDSINIWNEVDHAFIHALGGSSEQVDVQNQRDALLRSFSTAQDPYLEYCRFIGQKYNAALSAEELVKLRYRIANHFLTEVVDFKPDAELVLKRLKELGFHLVIASTTKKENLNIYLNENRNIRQKAPLDVYFSSLYTREDATKIKPHPEIHQRIMRELNVSPQECLVFEDSLIGVEAAVAAGIEVAVMYDRYSDIDREKIQQLATYYFSSFSHLLQTIEKEYPKETNEIV